ncbi:hypothetical protein CPB83DRAFT_881892 [Crepidotus variabilis]|uniref:Uncharacterized protein n=1 Tax=Crepidotus variabilis TaxID=179855 RepID=A0A9P6EJQ9_9AGAR|nr:hypothetical protein CPB83DRAFT_881892 [Crepidotus variabilis]
MIGRVVPVLGSVLVVVKRSFPDLVLWDNKSSFMVLQRPNYRHPDRFSRLGQAVRDGLHIFPYPLSLLSPLNPSHFAWLRLMEYHLEVRSPIRSKIWAISVLPLEMLSLAITFFRLIHRWRTRVLWWDDYLAFVALIAAIPFYWTTWILVIGSMELHQLGIWPTLTVLYAIETYSPSVQIVIAWIGIVTFLLTFCISGDPLWRAPYMCPATPLGSILPYTASITSDIALFLTPLRLFWNVQLPPVAKRLILAGFAATCMLLPIDAVNTAYGFMAIGGTSKGVALRALFMHLARYRKPLPRAS